MVTQQSSRVTWMLTIIIATFFVLSGCSDHAPTPRASGETSPGEVVTLDGLTSEQFKGSNFLAATGRTNNGELYLLTNTNHFMVPKNLGNLEPEISLTDMNGNKITDRYNVLNILATPDRFIAVGQVGTIYTSSNPLESWTEVETPTKSDLLTIAKSGNTLYVAGSHGTVLSSKNGGEKWNKQTYSVYTFFDMNFTDQTGWLAADYGTVLKSSPDSDTWATVRGGNIYNFDLNPYFTVTPTNRQEVFLAGLNGIYSITRDGGKSWTDFTFPGERTIYDSMRVRIADTSGYLVVTAAGSVAFVPAADPGCVYETDKSNRKLISLTRTNGTIYASGDASTVIPLVNLDEELLTGECTSATGG